MNKLIARAATLAATAALAATTALSSPAQSVSGDFVITGASGRVQAMDPSTGAMRTLAALGSFANAVTTGPQNYWNYVVEIASPNDHVLRVSPRTGNVNTVATLPGTRVTAGIAIDVDGSVLVTGQDGLLLNVRQNSVTTIARGLGAANAVAVDGDTGHYLIGAFGVLLQVDRRTLGVSTIATVDGHVTGIAVHPHNGHYVVTTLGQRKIVMIDRKGNANRWWTSGPNYAVAVDHATGDILAVGGGQIRRFNKKLAALWTRPTTGILTPTGVAFYGDRKLVGGGSLTKGGIFTATLNFADSPNAIYGGALSSVGVRPGIPVSGRTININFLDSLVYLSSAGHLEGLFTEDISGTLDGAGKAQIRVAVPHFMPANRNLYLVANAINPAKPGGLDFGNTLVIPVK